MRPVPVALLLCTSLLLAGCSGGGDDGEGDFHVTCPDGRELHSEDYANVTTTGDLLSKCSRTGTGSRSATTSQAPNQPPVLVLTISDAGGNATNVTLLDGNLTFSAEGSSDPDGQIGGIAVTVQDSNTTRTGVLYDAATRQFRSATFTFDRPGVVNVTVAMVDDRAGFTVNQTHVYVNELQQLRSETINIPGGDQLVDGGCEAADLDNAQYYKPIRFNLANGATMVEAVAAATGTDTGTPAGELPGEASLVVCSPEHQALSEPGNPTVATAEGVFAAPVSADNYYVGTTIEAPYPSVTVAVTVLVHYEPMPAAVLSAA